MNNVRSSDRRSHACYRSACFLTPSGSPEGRCVITNDGAAQPDGRENIASFLKALRLRLDPNAKVLGKVERICSRRGRRVTQEEIAEAVGVSRGWYALLESGAPIQPSVSLLGRLAGALNATPRERAMLFSLAIPELSTIFFHATE